MEQPIVDRLSKKYNELLLSITSGAKATKESFIEAYRKEQQEDIGRRKSINAKSPLYRFSKVLLITNVFPYLTLHEITQATEACQLFNVIFKSPIFFKHFTSIWAETQFMLSFENNANKSNAKSLDSHKVRMLNDFKTYKEQNANIEEDKNKSLIMTSKTLTDLYTSIQNENKGISMLIEEKMQHLKEYKQRNIEEVKDWEEEESLLKNKINNTNQDNKKLVYDSMLDEYKQIKQLYSKTYYDNCMSKIKYDETINKYIKLKDTIKRPEYANVDKVARKLKHS